MFATHNVLLTSVATTLGISPALIVGLNVTSATTINIPPHQIGDDLYIFAYRGGSSTAPPVPSASGTVPSWSTIAGGTGADTNSSILVHFVATAANHTSGTWTSSTDLLVVVVRGQTASPIGGSAESGSTSAVQAVAPSITLADSSGGSLLLHFFGHRATTTAIGSPPSGYTKELFGVASTASALLTKDTSTSDGAVTLPVSAGANGYRGASVEVKGSLSQISLSSSTSTGLYLGGAASLGLTTNLNDVVIVDIITDANLPTGVTCNGAAMTLLDSVYFNGTTGANGMLRRYTATGVALGSTTVAVTNTNSRSTIFARSYSNVASIGATTKTQTGASSQAASSTFSQSVSPTNGALAVTSLGEYSGHNVWATYSGGIYRGQIGAGDAGGSFSTAAFDSDVSATIQGTVGIGYWAGAMTTMLIPSSLPTITSVKFDALGAGDAANAGDLTWTHTAKANSYVIATLSTSDTNIPDYCRYDGVDMTYLGGSNWVSMYGILDTTGGTKTVTVSSSGTYISGNSVSYINVGQVDASWLVTGTSGAATQTVPCSLGSISVQAFGNYYSLTPLGGRFRYQSGGSFSDLTIADAVTEMTFTGNATTSNGHGGVAVVLSPTVANPSPYIVGTSAATATSVTLPPHQIGDLIVMFAYNGATFNTTVPGKPSASGTVPAWVDIDANTGSDSNAARTVQFVATATNHTSGTWTNTSTMVAVVIRGQNASTPIGGHAEAQYAGSTTPTAPSVTMADTSGKSLLLHFMSNMNANSISEPPAGYSRRAKVVTGSGPGVILNTKNVSTSGSAATNTSMTATSFGGRGATIEIRD